MCGLDLVTLVRLPPASASLGGVHLPYCTRSIGLRAERRYGVCTPFAQMKLSRQILAVNALLITTSVLAAMVVGRLRLDDVGSQRQGFVLVAAILATVLVNGLVLRRRFAPL